MNTFTLSMGNHFLPGLMLASALSGCQPSLEQGKESRTLMQEVSLSCQKIQKNGVTSQDLEGFMRKFKNEGELLRVLLGINELSGTRYKNTPFGEELETILSSLENELDKHQGEDILVPKDALTKYVLALFEVFRKHNKLGDLFNCQSAKANPNKRDYMEYI